MSYLHSMLFSGRLREFHPFRPISSDTSDCFSPALNRNSRNRCPSSTGKENRSGCFAIQVLPLDPMVLLSPLDVKPDSGANLVLSAPYAAKTEKGSPASPIVPAVLLGVLFSAMRAVLPSGICEANPTGVLTALLRPLPT